MSTHVEVEVEEIEIEEHTKKVIGKEKPPKAKKYVTPLLDLPELS